MREAAAAAGRDPDALTMCVAAPGLRHRRSAGLAHARDQCRWFGGMVGNHVADIVRRYGGDGAAVPGGADRLHRRPPGLRLQRARPGRATRTPTFVPDEIVDRFCLIGPPAAQVARLQELAALGVDQFALYLQHDAKDATLPAYGEHVIPFVSERVAAKS